MNDDYPINKTASINMEKMSISVYYKKVIELLLSIHANDFNNAVPGHCMKITGLAINELEYLWNIVNTRYANINSFIVSENVNNNSAYISATKLIEYRNKQDAPLLILIPSNSRTAAEDSYGNATFKEISLNGIEVLLKQELIKNIPKEFSSVIIDEIFKYLQVNIINDHKIISYLLLLEEYGYNSQNIGNFIYVLDLIPDLDLIIDLEKVRTRLNFNISSIDLLSSFSKPLYDRVKELPIELNTIQKDLVTFLKHEKSARNKTAICSLLFNKYPQLNFSNWKIPELNFSHIQLSVEELRATDFKLEEGKKVLEAETNKLSKIKIRFRTNPNPKDITDLKHFRVILMAVNGANGEEVMVLRKLKNTSSNWPYREATIELNPNLIEQGSYFFKILAEDELGNVLNANDDYRDRKIQKAFLNELNLLSDKLEITELKKEYPYKLTCDSDDFDFVVDDVTEKESNQRKDKLNNVLQAYFKYTIDQLKNSEETILPEENTNSWITDKKKHLSTYHINYSDKHNYQINISSKLREIENVFLENKTVFGNVKTVLKNNASALGFQSILFVKSDLLNEHVPKSILILREKVFTSIQSSTTSGDGIFETANIYNFKSIIKEYLQALTSYTTGLKEEILNININEEKRSVLQNILTDFQTIDLSIIKTKLPNGVNTEAILLSPLHPLRLSWYIQLIEVFVKWKDKTVGNPTHIEEWSKNLETLFVGDLVPENNLMVLVNPNTLINYLYAGELAYGWGIYFNVLKDESKNAMTSVSRQLKHYYRNLFNIAKENYVETDISLKLVIRHIKNYLSQHPYTDKLVINIINAGDANVFASAFVELEKEAVFNNIKYEIRIFKGNDDIIEHGESLKTLINPEFNISEEAEIFSQPSKNRLFPKLRFSINNMSDFLEFPSKFSAHISFLVSPFPVEVELINPLGTNQNFYLNALIADATVVVSDNNDQIKWNRYLQKNKLFIEYSGAGNMGIELFHNWQFFVAGALKLAPTEKIPSTSLRLNDKDKVLLTHLHDFSDWVITFDKNIGPQIYDQPSKEGKIPFLLDYVPGEEISGISSYLTTRPTSEVLGLLGPHFEEFNIDVKNSNDEAKVKILLEDLRAVSSSLVLQLNSSKNKAFEVIGSAFTKRVLEKKGLLENSFLIPIDLHQNLFENLSLDSKSRADNLLISMDPEKNEVICNVIEIKCRKSVGISEESDLKAKMLEQMENTVQALRVHFDSEFNLSSDRLDREVKNKELKSLFSFYIERAFRYEYLSENAYYSYNNFIQKLDEGFSFCFKKLGLIFDFSSEVKHKKQVVDKDLTYFTFGKKLIDEILDPESDLNTNRLEDKLFDKELGSVINGVKVLKPYSFNEIENKEIKQDLIINLKEKKTPVNNNLEVYDDNKIIIKESPVLKTVEDLSNIVKKGTKDISEHITPNYDVLIGKTSESNQYGLIGESLHGKKIAIDLDETNTISLFGVQGGGKSYTIGSVSEMVLKQFSNVNELPAPLAGVIFHYSESMDYEPEFTSMIYPNDKENELLKLKEKYGAEPDCIEDVIILTPKDKVEERKSEYPSINVLPIAFNSKELNVQDWLFILGALGNDSAYVKQLKQIMKMHRRDITIQGISESVDDSVLLSNSQKALARQKLGFASEYIDDDFTLREVLKPGRLVIVDLRDEFIDKDEALGLFVIMLNVFSSVKAIDDKRFNKFIVFDEAHKYMDNKDLTNNIVTAIREMRHKGVSIMIASQDPPSLPNEIIELSSIVLLHKFNSPQWLKHIQKSITQLGNITPSEMSSLQPGEGFLWATKATEKGITSNPIKISTRPRVTKHGGGTIKAV